MNCPDCTEATKQMHHGFHAECQGCAARALVRSPHYRAAFGSGGFGWHDRRISGLMEFYKVSRAEVAHAASVDAGHGERVA